MPKEYDDSSHEDEKNRVTSGETEELQNVQGTWNELYKVECDTKWTYEKVTEDPKPFLEAIEGIKAIPAYRYVIRYLISKTGLPVDDSKKGNGTFEDYIAEKKFLETSEQDDANGFQEFWKILIDRLNHLFWQNGYKETMNWTEFFLELLASFHYNSLKQLALGIHMPVEDFNIFLTKVLKRSYTNFYDRDEIFVYLTLKYADEFGNGKYYQAYERFYELYPLKEHIEKPKWMELTDSISTISLRDELEDKVSHIRGSLFEETDAELESYLDYIMWQNERLKSKDILRTAKRRLRELWDEIRQKCDESGVLAEIIRTEKEEQKQKNTVDGLFWKELTVHYNPEMECIFPDAMKFKTKTSKESIKGNQVAVFSLKQEHTLPAAKMESVEVKVKALMSKTEFDKKKKPISDEDKKLMSKTELEEREKTISALAELKQFIPSRFFEELEEKNCRIRKKNEKAKEKKPEINFSKIKVCTKKLKNEIGKIQINDKKKPRFWADSEKENEGFFQIECKTGTFIPKGTRFSFELEGVRFLYESVEDANTYTFDIPVRPLQKWDEKWEDAGMKKKDCIKKKEQLRISDDWKEKVEGLRTVSIEKSEMLGFFVNSRKENYITVSCQKTCNIPEGTIFEYHDKGKVFYFESVADVVKKPYAEAKVNAVWDNVEEFQRQVADKDITFLPSNVKFTCDLENVYEVYAKKRTTLQPVTVQVSEKKDYKAGDSILFRYIYQTSAGNAERNGYYQGFPEYGDDYFLNTRLFKDTRIIRNHLEVPPNDEERLRNLILTLKFLEFVWWDDDYDLYGADSIDEELQGADCIYEIVRDFKTNAADEEMEKCGFHAFSTNFAYDAFLALLLSSNDPWALFQAIWSDQPLAREPLHRKEK